MTQAKRVRKAKVVQAPVEQITEEQANAILDAAGTDVPLADVVKDVKRRKPSTKDRDEHGKVVRQGKNLSGNMPFRRKLYFFDLEQKAKPDYEKAFNAAPMQVRLIMKYMEEEGISTVDDAQIGAEIAGGAINSGKLNSKIDPAALFAYYRRVMETLGLRLATTK